MVSKITKEHLSLFFGILTIAGIWVAVFYGYIASLNSRHKIAECEAYAKGKYSVTNDRGERDVMMDECTENYN